MISLLLCSIAETVVDRLQPDDVLFQVNICVVVSLPNTIINHIVYVCLVCRIYFDVRGGLITS